MENLTIEVTLENLESVLKNRKNSDDFNANGNGAKLEKGKKYLVNRSRVKPSTIKNGEVETKVEFLEYFFIDVETGLQVSGSISYNRIKCPKFVEVKKSERTKNNYSKFEMLNSFGAPDGVSYGEVNLTKAILSKTLLCTEIIEDKHPAFDATLIEGKTPKEMEVKTMYKLELV